MYCRNCGAQNEDGVRFCGECGSPVHEESTVQYRKIDTSSSDFVSRVVAIIGIICFAFEFIYLGFIDFSVRGIDMIWVWSGDIKSNYTLEGIDMFNIFIAASAICAVVSLFLENARKYLSIAAGGILFLFRIFGYNFVSFDKGEHTIGDFFVDGAIDEGIIELSFGPSLYIAMIIFIGVGVYLIIRDKKIYE